MFLGVKRSESATGFACEPHPGARAARKPSIALLPFQNMSGESEQEYFADGITEDVLTELSRFRELFVISRNSAFVYKGGQFNVQKVAKELGVQYIVEGSVRKAGNRVRITVQLIDAETRQPPVGRALRPGARRHLRDPGRGDVVDCLDPAGRVEAAATTACSASAPKTFAAMNVCSRQIVHHRPTARTIKKAAAGMLDRASRSIRAMRTPTPGRLRLLGQSFVNGWSATQSSRYAP